MLISRILQKYKVLVKIFLFLSSIVFLFLPYYFNYFKTTQPAVLCKIDKKVVINLRSGFEFLRRFPKAFECNSAKLNNSWSQPSMSSSNDTNYNYSQPAPKNFHRVEITRAIVLQFPIKEKNQYLIEFKWLYLSWVQMMNFEPYKWKTDLVVFVEKDQNLFKNSDFFLNKLKCRFDNIRKSEKDPPMCTLIDYRPFSRRNFSFEDIKNESLSSLYKHLIENVNIFEFEMNGFDKFYKLMKREVGNYKFLDSILVGFEGYEYFKTAGFDFILRSDIDVFLTPLFGTWLPRHCNDFNIGGGAWWDEYNEQRLRLAGSRLFLDYPGILNLGSTWYSTPDQIRLVSYLTIFGIIFLSIEEFTSLERLRGVDNWPKWHYNVVLLYGQSLVLNHFVATNQTSVVFLDQHIDFQSRLHKSIYHVVHIHAFRLPGVFNKIAFKNGSYDGIELSENQLNSDDVVDYSLRVALVSKRTTYSALAKLYQNTISYKKNGQQNYP